MVALPKRVVCSVIFTPAYSKKKFTGQGEIHQSQHVARPKPTAHPTAAPTAHDQWPLRPPLRQQPQLPRQQPWSRSTAPHRAVRLLRSWIRPRTKLVPTRRRSDGNGVRKDARSNPCAKREPACGPGRTRGVCVRYPISRFTVDRVPALSRQSLCRPAAGQIQETDSETGPRALRVIVPKPTPPPTTLATIPTPKNVKLDTMMALAAELGYFCTHHLLFSGRAHGHALPRRRRAVGGSGQQLAGRGAVGGRFRGAMSGNRPVGGRCPDIGGGSIFAYKRREERHPGSKK